MAAVVCAVCLALPTLARENVISAIQLEVAAWKFGATGPSYTSDTQRVSVSQALCTCTAVYLPNMNTGCQHVDSDGQARLRGVVCLWSPHKGRGASPIPGDTGSTRPHLVVCQYLHVLSGQAATCLGAPCSHLQQPSQNERSADSMMDDPTGPVSRNNRAHDRFLQRPSNTIAALSLSACEQRLPT